MSIDDKNPKKAQLLSELESIEDSLKDGTHSPAENVQRKQSAGSDGFNFDELENDDLDIDIPILEDVVADKAESTDSDANTMADATESPKENSQSTPEVADNDSRDNLADHSETAGNTREEDELFPIDEPDTEIPEPSKPDNDTELDINLLIQELVDEFIPQIEARLIKKLSKFDPQLIRKLATKILKP